MKYQNSNFRESIVVADDETVIHSADVLSQPHWRASKHTDKKAYTKCARSIPVAGQKDIVVLADKIDAQYLAWLRDYGLGPREVVEYHQPTIDKTLSEIIIENPKPVLSAIEKVGLKPVYVPYHTGEQEHVCAKVLCADLFGSEVGVCEKYFDKDSFKKVCQTLEIPTVGGSTHSLTNSSADIGEQQLEELVHAMLSNYQNLIIRGATGSGGLSLYETNRDNIDEVCTRIKDSSESNVLVEPKLKVVVSPNDQWVIGRDETVHHLGVSAQLFEGLKHAGNLRGQYFSPRVYKYIVQQSKKIVHKMLEDGYVGALGIDYIIAEEGIFPIENNARVNGSTYTMGIVQAVEENSNKKIPCWKFYKAQTTPCTFSELVKRAGKLIYSGSNSNAMVPYDVDRLGDTGEFACVLLAEDMYHIDYLEDALSYLGVKRV